MTFNKKVGVLAAMSSLVVVSAVSADDGLKVGGFVDPQLIYRDVGTTETEMSFQSVLNDGAVYFSKSLGEGSVSLDLAFGDIQFSEYNTAPAGVGLFGTSGTAKSQAFVAYKYSNGISWKFGQFDGIFGHERNDTVDVFFASQGQVFTLQPRVHQALLVGYDVSSALAVHAYVGGSDGSGWARRPTVGQGNAQIGAKVAYNDAFRVSLGGWMESERFAADAAAMFINVMAGMDFGDLSLDVEYDMLNTGVDGADAQTAIGAYVGYSLGETTKLGARFTTNTNDSDADAEAGTTQISVGPSFAMTKDLNVKVNLNYNMFEADGVDAQVSGALAATYRF
jgi:hypothetical protein